MSIKGNQNAARAREWRDAIVRQVAKKGGSYADGLALAAEQLLTKALAGEQWALLELGNRIDGKPTEYVEMNMRRVAEDMADDELARIATGSGAGITEAPTSPQEPSPVH